MGVSISFPRANPVSKRKVRPVRLSASALELDVDSLLARVSQQEVDGDALEQALIALQSDLARVAEAP